MHFKKRTIEDTFIIGSTVYSHICAIAVKCSHNTQVFTVLTEIKQLSCDDLLHDDALELDGQL